MSWQTRSDLTAAARRSTRLPARGIPVWDETALDLFLESPDDVAPVTDMTFVGLRDPAERADVIAYLVAQARPE